MMRVAALGDSHLVAFKDGWDDVGSLYPDVELRFFSAGKDDARNCLLVEGSALVATDLEVRRALERSSRGMTSVPADFDAYLLVGWGVDALSMMNRLNKSSPWEFHAERPDTFLISESYSRRAFEAYFEMTAAAVVARRLGEITTAPIYFAPSPLGCETVLDDETVTVRLPLKVKGAAKYIDGHYRNGLTLLAKYGTVLEQPPETIVREFFTAARYAKPRPPDAIRRHDFSHKTAEFGAIWLREFLAQIGASRGTLSLGSPVRENASGCQR